MSKHRKHHRSNSGPKTRQQGQTYQYSRFSLAAKPQVQPFQYDGKFSLAKPVKGLPAPKKGTTKVTALDNSKGVVEDAGKKYVVDTNVLISCPNIIADPNDELWQEVIGADPKLNNATIIIPQVVFDELDHMKSEVSRRGMVARMLLRRLANIITNTKRSLEDIATMRDPVLMGWKNQSVCILPLPKDFYRILPWVPDRNDNDGWIAVTALYATLFYEGVDINALISNKKEKTENDEAKEQQFDIMQWRTKKKDDSIVFLMTNDNGLLVRANNYGVRTKHFRFKKPRVITGFRDMIVPREFYELALENAKDGLEAEYFEQFFPEEPPLTANEYIIMHLEHEERYPSEYLIDSAEFKNIFRYIKKNNRLFPMRCVNYEGQKPINAGIAAYYDAMNDKNIKVINVTGMAGTGKTYQAITHSIKAIRNGEFVRAILIPAKSANNPLGALPGNKEQKMEPLVAVAKSAIRSYLSETPTFKDWRARLRKFSEEPQTDEKKTKGEKYDKKDKNDSKKKKERHNSNRYYDTDSTTGSSPGTFDDLDGNGYANLPVKNGNDDGHSKKKDAKTYYLSKGDKAQAGVKKKTYSEALEEQVDLTFRNYFTCVPLEEVQGCTFDHSIIIVDEAQRIKTDTADTILPRAGRDSKLFVLGDVSQIQDSNREKQFNNALYYSRELFFDNEICANILLTENLRSDIADVMTRNRNLVRLKMGLI